LGIGAAQKGARSKEVKDYGQQQDAASGTSRGDKSEPIRASHLVVPLFLPQSEAAPSRAKGQMDIDKFVNGK